MFFFPPPSRAVAAALFAAALGVPGIAAAQSAQVERVSVTEIDGGARVAVDLAEARRPSRHFFLNGPDRFVLDLPDAHWAQDGQGAGAGLALRRRFANQPNGSARLVLDLAGPARLLASRVERGGRRLVFDLEGEAGFVAVSAPIAPAHAALPVAAPARQRLVVIDAGHGGRDPGATGVSGVREKDVVLAHAQALKALLEARGYQVAMTRDGDSFLELPDRVTFAREREADLFISLHADAAPGSQARGAAVYMLSERGVNRSRTLRNAQDWHVDAGAASGMVQNILFELTQRETTNRSAEFAQTVLSEIGEADIPIMHRTPRNAGFYVLLAPDVPAVLVEMGFLTQAQDEARLADGAQQARMARALADAVDGFFAGPRLMADAR